MQEFFANFQFVDYVLLGITAIVGVLGAIKGFLRRIVSVIGIVLTILLTSWLCQYPREWLSSVISDESARSILALVATFVVVGLVVALVMKSIENKIQNQDGMKLLDVLLGFCVNVGIVYVSVGIVWTVCLSWAESTSRLLTAISTFISELLNKSFLTAKLFTDNAFIKLITHWLFGI